MISIQEFPLPQAKLKESNQLIKGVLVPYSLVTLMIYNQECFNISVAFHQKEARNKLSSPDPSRNLSNWYGGNLTKQGDMFTKNSYPYFFWEKP